MQIGTLLVGLIILIGVFYAVRTLMSIRDFIQRLVRGLIAGAVLVAVVSFLPGNRQSHAPLAVTLGVLGFLVGFGKRSRHIPALVKRKVVSRDLKEKRYDPKIHEIDHVWPFALGGGHTVDNLRVVHRRVNRKKGKRLPKPTDWM